MKDWVRVEHIAISQTEWVGKEERADKVFISLKFKAYFPYTCMPILIFKIILKVYVNTSLIP